MWAESAQDTGGPKEQQGTEVPLWMNRLRVRHSHGHSQLLQGSIPIKASWREGKHSERPKHSGLRLLVLQTAPEKQDRLRHREQTQMMRPTPLTPNVSLAACPRRTLLSTQSSGLKTWNLNIVLQSFGGKELACACKHRQRIKIPLTATPIRKQRLALKPVRKMRMTQFTKMTGDNPGWLLCS